MRTAAGGLRTWLVVRVSRSDDGRASDCARGYQPLFFGRNRSCHWVLIRPDVNLNSESTPSRHFFKHMWRHTTNIAPEIPVHNDTLYIYTLYNYLFFSLNLPKTRWQTSPTFGLRIYTFIIGDFAQFRMPPGQSAAGRNGRANKPHYRLPAARLGRSWKKRLSADRGSQIMLVIIYTRTPDPAQIPDVFPRGAEVNNTDSPELLGSSRTFGSTWF